MRRGGDGWGMAPRSVAPPVCLWLLLCLGGWKATAQLVINEVMSSNSRTILDEDGDSSDWIELWNRGSDGIDLSGYGLSDREDDPLQWVFAPFILGANEHLLVFASGKDRQLIPDSPRLDPGTVSGLSLWLVAEDAVVREGDTSEQRVAEWLDRSSSSRVFRSQDGRGAPLRVPGSQNGDSVIRFSEESRALIGPEVRAGSLASGEALSLFVVQRPHAPRDTGSSFLFETGSGRRINVHAPWSDGVMYFDFGRVAERGRLAVAPPGGFLDEWRILTFLRSDDDRGAIYVNGTLLTEGTMKARLDPLESGALSVGAFGFRGELAEIVMLEHAADSELRAGIEQYLSEKYGVPIRGGRHHSNFKLKAEGEEVRLSDPNGNRLDTVPAIRIPTDRSFGRTQADVDLRQFFELPSPERANEGKGLGARLPPPVLTHESGYYADPFRLGMGSGEAGVVLRYTLDGSLPESDSSLFEQALEIGGGIDLEAWLSGLPTNPSRHRTADGRLSMPEPRRSEFGWIEPGGVGPQATVVRVRAFAEGHLPSEVVTRTFFVGQDPGRFAAVPVLSIVVDPDRWFDSEEGLYRPGTRYDPSAWSHRYWGTGNYFLKGRFAEDVATIDVFNGSANWRLGPLGIRLHGGGSRAQPQKALRLIARGSLGEDWIRADPILSGGRERYRQLVVRNAGQDSAFHPTLIRDMVIQEAAPPADP